MSARVISPWRATVAAGLAALLAVTGMARSGSAYADDLPNDPAANGYIGFCGVDDKQMTGGSIHDTPFVWKAVSSVLAPPDVRGHGQVATLYLYQPRPNVPADEWTGDNLTAASQYTAMPTAQATKLDLSLADFIAMYPPQMDGLYELRIYGGKALVGTDSTTYPATFIRVTGDRWNVVGGGGVDCGKNSAQSNEVEALGKKAVGTPTASAPMGHPVVQPAGGAGESSGSSNAGAPANGAPSSGAAGGAANAPSPSGTGSDGSGTDTVVAASGASGSQDAAARRNSSSGGDQWWWLVVAIPITAALGGLVWLRRRSA